MDPVSPVGVAAAVLQFAELAVKVGTRLAEFTNSDPGDVPKALVDIVIQLPLITKSLSTIKDEGNIETYDNETRLILHGVVVGCLKLVRELEHLADRISPKVGESLNAKLKKAFSGIKNENRISEIDRGLQAYIQVLILHQVVNPKDVPAGLQADTTYYEVKEIRVENPLSRQTYLTRLHKAFRKASRNQLEIPEYVVLTGETGVGKTQLALEYCQEARNADHFRAIFWLDASSPASLNNGLESTSAIIRRTKAGSAEEKIRSLKAFLSGLWHSWLLVVDNYEPSAFIGVHLTKILPSEGHGAILILTRTPQALDVPIEIKVGKALTEQEDTAWRCEISDAVRKKQMSIVVDALANGFDVNSLSASGRWQNDNCSMVQLAAERGFAEAVQLFLDMGADPRLIENHSTVLSAAAESGDVPTLRVYLEYERKTGYRLEDDDYAFAVSRAISDNSIDSVRVLLGERGDRVDRNSRWLTHSRVDHHAIESAAGDGHLECIRLIADSDKLPDSPKDRASILSAAVKSGRIEVVRYLIRDAHFDPNELDHYENSALINAIYSDIDLSDERRNEIVTLLLDAGAQIDLKSCGFTPLHRAVFHCLVSTAKLLLDHGADLSIKAGFDVLEPCISQGNSEMNKILSSVTLSNPEANSRYYTHLLFIACRQGDHNLAIQVLEQADINAIDGKTRETPLIVAIRKRQLEIARVLVRKGARQDIIDKAGNSPLLLAARNNMDLLFQDLAKAKDSPKLQDIERYAALMMATNSEHYTRLLFLACRQGDRTLAIQALKQVDVNTVDEKTGETPLIVAITKGQLAMARMLVRKGAKQGITDKAGNSPLRLAAGKNMDLLIQDLAKAKDSPGLDDSDGEGYTALMIAAKAGHCEAVRMLLSLGADRDAVNDFGETALDIAQESRDEKVIALLEQRVVVGS